MAGAECGQSYEGHMKMNILYGRPGKETIPLEVKGTAEIQTQTDGRALILFSRDVQRGGTFNAN
jgi:hypothetical protein